MYTKYLKMFDYLPYFGYTIGLAHGYEGFLTKEDKETGSFSNIDGATMLKMEVLEIPFMMEGHYDMEYLKLFADIGFYGGYRYNMERESESGYIEEKYLHDFYQYEYRFDYGMEGSAGIAFMIDPIELHFNAMVRWGWQSLYRPDYYSQYYYRYAYPLDIIVTAGIHFQLGKRSGKTSSELRKQAKEIVYGKTEDTSR